MEEQKQEKKLEVTQENNSPQKPLVREIILEELEPEEVSKLNKEVVVNAVKFPKGTKVKVANYMLPADPRNGFDWNGKIGVIIDHIYVGTGVGNRPVYDYRVHFSEVEIPFTRLNAETGRLQRGIRISDAENIFDEYFLVYANE